MKNVIAVTARRSRFNFVFEQSRKTKATERNSRRHNDDEYCLRAGFLQLVRQILSQFAEFAVKDSDLSPCAPIISHHGCIFSEVRPLRPAPIEDAGSYDSSKTYGRANTPRSASPP